MNPYADFVMQVDHHMGQILTTLKEEGISDNTIVIFTSDNGCSPEGNFEVLGKHGHDPSAIYRGHKADLYEGGHRVPFIVQWKNKINPNSKSNETICLTDLMATASAIVNDSLKNNEGEDSYNLLPVLFENKLGGSLREATVHHSINGSEDLRYLR